MAHDITCPHCQTPISLDEALIGQIRSSIETQFKTQSKKQREELEATYKRQMDEHIKEMKRKLEEELSGKQQLELKFLQEQLEEKKKNLQEAQKRELELRKKEAYLEEQQQKLQLEIERRLAEERKLIREKTQGELIEQFRQKDLEKDKQIQDLKKLLEDAQRKATQTSQQLQGEVRELELEEMLRSAFPHDLVEPVGKGVTGADVRQIVKSPGGTICGVILWERKQTKAWKDEWIGKLKSDQRNEKADIAALVTAIFKTQAWNGMALYEGVWICNFSLILPLAMLLRKTLIDVAYQKAVASHRGSKAELIYEYITGHEFRQQIEALVEVYKEMHDQVQKERLVFEKSWKMREAQVKRLYMSTANIFGSIQGLAGASAVPELKGLELLGDGGQ